MHMFPVNRKVLVMELREKKRKCLIWGNGNVYFSYFPHLQYEITKGNIELQAIISKEQEVRIQDGIPVIRPEAIAKQNFDYIIVLAGNYEQIRQEAIAIGVEPEKIISGEIIGRAGFDFYDYIMQIENKLTIISDDCWAVNIYNHYKLQWATPFSMTFIDAENYLRLLGDFEWYMNQPLLCLQDYDEERNLFPIGILEGGDKGKAVQICFIHEPNFESAKNNWNRRKKRINPDNMWVKMIINNDEEAELFEKLPFKHKIGFYHKQTNFKSIIYVPRYKYINRKRCGGVIGYNFRTYVMSSGGIEKDINLLALFAGKDNYKRAE